jgi:hypothetical protein
VNPGNFISELLLISSEVQASDREPGTIALHYYVEELPATVNAAVQLESGERSSAE